MRRDSAKLFSETTQSKNQKRRSMIVISTSAYRRLTGCPAFPRSFPHALTPGEKYQRCAAGDKKRPSARFGNGRDIEAPAGDTSSLTSGRGSVIDNIERPGSVRVGAVELCGESVRTSARGYPAGIAIRARGSRRGKRILCGTFIRGFKSAADKRTGIRQKRRTGITQHKREGPDCGSGTSDIGKHNESRTGRADKQ